MQEMRHGKVSVNGGAEPKRTILKGVQLFRILKICTIILLAGCLQAYATGYGQKITLNEKEVPLTKIFKEIKKQTGFRFFYLSQQMSAAKKVTIHVKDASLNDVLQLCFKDQPFGWEVKENVIIIKEKISVTTSVLQELTSPPIDIRGKVIDENGKPVPGVTVTIKGSKRQTITNDVGEFSFIGVESSSVLSFSSVNMEPFSLHVSGQNDIVARLKTKTSELDEVQIIAYGTTTKRFNTGNVATVKASDIEKQPVSNPLLALQGRVPGLEVIQNTGVAGGGVKVRIQGQNSLTNGSDPLYIVDGMPISSQNFIPFGSILGNSGGVLNESPAGFGSPLSYLNPADIESIEILKDADATAIYGSRAAGGAILITTKKGKAGNTKATFDYQEGSGKITRKLKMLNTHEYLMMRHEAKQNDNLPITSADYDINGTWDTTRYTDWQKELIGGISRYTNINAGISGGSSNVQYLVGTTYHRETSVFPGNFEDRKISLHFNINSLSLNQKFRFQFVGNYLIDDNRLPGLDLTQNALSFEPVAPQVYNPDGSLNWATNASGTSTWNNPLVYVHKPYKNKTRNLISSGMLSYRIMEGLEIKANLGYSMVSSDLFQVTNTPETNKPELRAFFPRSSAFGYHTSNSWNVEPQLNYNVKIGKGNLDILAGSTILQNKTNGLTVSASGFTSAELMENSAMASTSRVGSTRIVNYKYNAAFGKLNYNLLEKYLINFTVRRDGTSRFGKENRFHNFGSIGSAWIFSEEKFIRRNLPVISFGKIKASYGVTGSDQIADYGYLNLYGAIPSYIVNNNYQGIVSLQPEGLTNPQIAWEETKKTYVAVDLGFFNDRIIANVGYSSNRSSNQLLRTPLPIATGSAEIYQNFPATVGNETWEFSVNASIIKTKDFSWSSNFNMTVPKNKLIKFPGLNNSFYSNNFVEGKSLNLTRVARYAGVELTTGLYNFFDAHGDLTTTPSVDDMYFITLDSKFYGGFQNNFTYKGFRFDVLMQFTKKTAQNFYYATYGMAAGRFFTGFSNQPASVLNRWQKPGDAAPIQKFTTGGTLSYLRSSDAYFTDASFIRIKNISLSYDIPLAWRRKVHLDNCRLYIHGQNLFTITKYKGLDPETGRIDVLPPLKVLTAGIQLVL
jgi:TonB-linked SusC/RagA family outer membrane protein